MGNNTNKFRTYGYIPTEKGTKFNQKAYFIKKGKKIIIQDFINENGEGLNFYENLEKLGSVENTIAYMQRNAPQLYGDFNDAQNLRNAEEERIALHNIYDRLPADIRDKEFGNDFETFCEKGSMYFEKVKAKYIKEIINEKDTGNQPSPNETTADTKKAGSSANGNQS